MKQAKKQRSSHKHRPVASHRKVRKSVALLMIGIWLVVILCAGFVAFDYFQGHRSLSITQGGIELRVSKVEYDDVGIQPFATPPGWKYEIVYVTVVNNGRSVFNFAPVLQTYLTDKNGGQYYMSPAILSDPITAGPIASHHSVSGSLSYLVPIHTNNTSLQFQP